MSLQTVAFALAAALCACNGELRFDEESPHSGDGGRAHAGCAADTDCAEPGYPRCDSVLSLCVSCVVSADCGPGRTCEPTTRRCVTSCTDSSNACQAAGGECSDQLKICVACGDDTRCPSRSAPICDPAVGLCVACVTDAQCPLETPYCDRTRGACE